jgi:hypothetical protein
MKKINSFIYWTPRILAILFICFLAMLSLDVFEEGMSAGEITQGLLMHNIPVFILIAVLIVSWKYEIVGGIIFILAGLLYMGMTVFATTRSGGLPWYIALSWIVQISGPAFIAGILFFINWQKK